jgi:hypothetical protein
MNSVAHESPASITLAMFTGLVIFILAMSVFFFAIYTLVQTGQSILGEITFTPAGWPYP